jgi:signal peptidase I
MGAADTAGSKRARRGRALLRLLVTIALVAWAVRSLVFAPFSIPSGSMLPTLRVGDYLLVAKWPYGYSRFSFPLQIPPIDGRLFERLPERGDIVVFELPGRGGEDLIKRVIGLPGDTVELRHGTLILNGRAVSRSKSEPISIPVSPNSPCRRITERGIALAITNGGDCVYSSYRETLPNGASYRVIDQVNNGSGDDFAATVVPSGHVFLMGDNRDDSLDSRFSAPEGGVGPVPVDRLVGRAAVVFWSTDGGAHYAKPWTWFSSLRGHRIGTGLGADR